MPLRPMRLSGGVTDLFWSHPPPRASRITRAAPAHPPLSLIRQAIEYYLDDIEDLRCGAEALKDPADPVLDWAEVRNTLLAVD